MNVAGKVCVLTGASSGIGRQTALDLAQAGATLCVAARREPELQSLVDEIGGTGAGHSYVVCDVSDRAQVRAVADHVESTYGRCDALINNAGFSTGDRPFSGDDDIEDLHATMATNFFGTAYCTAALLPLLERSAPSHVVNVASVAGRLALASSSAYCASKFAVVGWSESLHFDLAPKGITVSLIEPGPIPTEGFPQTALLGSSLLRFAVGSTADVSKAIRNAIEHNRMQRVVPRWYYALQIPRLVAPPSIAPCRTGSSRTSLAKG
ncbi:MAG: SDR family NAD(P)-dependent oxidoreductase [Actinomycetota bacterium]